jgi:hypothetical protein
MSCSTYGIFVEIFCIKTFVKGYAILCLFCCLHFVIIENQYTEYERVNFLQVYQYWGKQ